MEECFFLAGDCPARTSPKCQTHFKCIAALGLQVQGSVRYYYKTHYLLDCFLLHVSLFPLYRLTISLVCVGPYEICFFVFAKYQIPFNSLPDSMFPISFVLNSVLSGLII